MNNMPGMAMPAKGGTKTPPTLVPIRITRSIGPCARSNAHEGLCYPFSDRLLGSVKVLLPATVTPAEAGVQRLSSESAWIPAFAGMTRRNLFFYEPRKLPRAPIMLRKRPLPGDRVPRHQLLCFVWLSFCTSRAASTRLRRWSFSRILVM